MRPSRSAAVAIGDFESTVLPLPRGASGRIFRQAALGELCGAARHSPDARLLQGRDSSEYSESRGSRDAERVDASTDATTARAEFSPESRLIVTGQIGCGKTTLARRICDRLGVAHLHIDDYHDDNVPFVSAERAASAIDAGWVAEACVWQIPQGIWESADLVVHLDYSNSVHYRRIVRRCLRNCLVQLTGPEIRNNVRAEWLHLRIMYRFANENRATWRREGGITRTRVPVIRLVSPRETDTWISSALRGCSPQRA